MSKSRVAELMQAATGMDYKFCRQAQLERRVWPKLPVPDAVSDSQARFEALVVHTLAEPLRDRQLGGAVLGITEVDLQTDVPVCFLHPLMAHRVASLLLPHFDADYGGIVGLPGARPRIVNGGLIYADLFSDAAIELRMDGSEADAMTLPEPRRGMRSIWRSAEPSVEETEERAWWAAEANRAFGVPGDLGVFATRDLLFSRLLRRPGLINKVASGHGYVNSYTHGHDLVLEWCCGVTFHEMRCLLDESGVTTRLPKSASWKVYSDEGDRGEISIDRDRADGSQGSCFLVLRSGQPCSDEDSVHRIREGADTWYQ